MTDEPEPPRPTLRRFRRPLLATSGIVLGPFLLYGLFVLVGMWPVNRGFRSDPKGVAIYVASSPVHTDLVLPIRRGDWDWSERFPADTFPESIDWATHYAIGWGDRGFYLDTPTWNDLKASTAVKALCMPSGTVIHVQATIDPEGSEGYTRIDLPEEAYRHLCDAIADGLSADAEPIAGESYGDYDNFYPAKGSYSALYTCNSWAGDKLKHAGVCVPMWTPLPGSTTWYVESPEAKE
ncbi:hypothetical protein MalM25_33750 [Planctomycetes bacterium MalM25]|nr:hypothetical protein MalM25_33750 [Planctomycetes bacterium MalM25]